MNQFRANRRSLLALSGLALPAAVSGRLLATADAQQNAAATGVCLLGFSTYAMRQMESENAIRMLAEIGFDAVELAVRKGWDADSAELSSDRRATIRRALDASSIRLTSLMEHVFPSSDDQQRVALERIRLAADVAHDLSPQAPPVIQTVLGGGEFEHAKTRLRDRLGQWLQIADDANVTIAIKPHRGGVVSKPDEAIWLIEQLGNPSRLRMVYDFSHYAFRGMTLDATLNQSLPYLAHVAVKDAVQEDDQVRFDLPGTAKTIDFAKLIRSLFDGGYRGDINCEVSSHVSRKEDYDVIAAAKTCYRNLDDAFARSGVARPK